MSLLSEFLEKHPSIQAEPNWMIKSITEQTIKEMSAAIEEECRNKGVNKADLVLYCYINGEPKLVNTKHIEIPCKEIME